MKGTELKLELKKRNLVINGKKPDFQQRLREYLATPWIEEEQKKQIDIQTSGYCRRFEKAIPFVLVEIIKSYGLTTGEGRGYFPKVFSILSRSKSHFISLSNVSEITF